MRNQNKHYKNIIILISVITFLFSCKLALDKEIYIKTNEIGVYYDSTLDTTIVLNNGKYSISRKSILNRYSLKDTVVIRTLELITKDTIKKTYTFNYHYNINPKNIIEFNNVNGLFYLENYLAPRLITNVRISFRKLKSTDDDSKIKIKLINEFKRDTILSKFINTKNITFVATPKALLKQIVPYKEKL